MKHRYEIGDSVRCIVTGEYVIEQEVTGVIQHFFGNDRVKIKVPTGQCYMVHLRDCEKVSSPSLPVLETGTYT